MATSRSRSAVPVAVLVATTALALTFAFVQASRATDLRTLSRELKELRADTANARSRDDAPRVVVVRPPPDPAKEPSTPAEPLPSPAVPSEAAGAAESTADAVTRITTTLEARLAGEPVDVHFERDVTRLAASTLAEHAPGSRIDDAECGSTLCRLIVSHESPAQAKGLATAVAEFPPFGDGTFYAKRVIEEGTRPTTVTFVFRPGHGPLE